MMEQKLYFPGQENATMFFYLEKDGGSFVMTMEREDARPRLTLRGTTGDLFVRAEWGKPNTLPAGIYSLTLTPDPAKTACYFTVKAEEGCYPFLQNGTGVWHADFPEKSIWLPAGKQELYIAVPECDEPVMLSTFRLQNPKPRIFRPEGTEYVASWIPEYAAWYETDIPVKGHPGYWRVEAEHTDRFRLTTWNGYAMFFEKPKTMLPYAFFTPVCDEEIDYRVNICRGDHIDVAVDRLYTEKAPIPYLPGELTVTFDAGGQYSRVERQMPKGDKTTISVHFDRLISIPDGWLYGDCHFHSGYEDACCTPRVITKAGRCNGLDFIFLTDHGGKNIVDNGLYTYREAGRFETYPGQECVNLRTHMNFLNVPFNIDYKGQTEEHWLRDAEKKNPEGNLYVPMLNHPDAAYTREANPYFRSWWVATQHKEIPLVENIGNYRALFDFLNHDRPLVLLNTSDTHDGTKYRPGQSGVFVYTGGKNDAASIVTALRQGRVSTCHKSGGVFLTYTVDGHMPGDHLSLNKDSYEVDIELRMTGYQIKKLAIVKTGYPLQTFETADLPVQTFHTTVTREALLQSYYATVWLAILGYSDVSQHENKPYTLDTAGIECYANPVWFDGAEPRY